MLRFGDHPLDIEVAALVTKAARRVREARLQGRGGRRPPSRYADAGRTFVVHWLTALQRLLQLYPESRHGEFDPNLLASAKAGAALFAAGRRRCPGDAARAGDRLEPVLRQVRPAAVARRRRAALRGRQEPAARARTARPNALWSPYTSQFNLTPPSRACRCRAASAARACRSACRSQRAITRTRSCCAPAARYAEAHPAEIPRPAGDQVMTADLAMMPAHELVKLYKARKASPVEATQAALARIEAFNPQLNAFQHLDPDGRCARRAPRRSAGRRAASGFPTSTACRSPSRTWC